MLRNGLQSSKDPSSSRVLIHPRCREGQLMPVRLRCFLHCSWRLLRDSGLVVRFGSRRYMARQWVIWRHLRAPWVSFGLSSRSQSREVARVLLQEGLGRCENRFLSELLLPRSWVHLHLHLQQLLPRNRMICSRRDRVRHSNSKLLRHLAMSSRERTFSRRPALLDLDPDRSPALRPRLPPLH